MLISAADIDVVQRVVQDVGDHELAVLLVDLHRRMARDFAIRAAHPPAFYVVSAALRDTEDQVNERIEISFWLAALQDGEIVAALEDDDLVDGLCDYVLGHREDPNVPAWCVRSVQNVNEVLNDDVGRRLDISERELHAWVKVNRPEVWQEYETAHLNDAQRV